jgi:hypothetical protein
MSTVSHQQKAYRANRAKIVMRPDEDRILMDAFRRIDVDVC